MYWLMFCTRYAFLLFFLSSFLFSARIIVVANEWVAMRASGDVG